MNNKVKDIPINTIVLIVIQFVGVLAWTFTMQSDINRNAESILRMEISKEKSDSTLSLMEKDITKILTILSFALEVPDDIIKSASISTSFLQ